MFLYTRQRTQIKWNFPLLIAKLKLTLTLLESLNITSHLVSQTTLMELSHTSFSLTGCVVNVMALLFS